MNASDEYVQDILPRKSHIVRHTVLPWVLAPPATGRICFQKKGNETKMPVFKTHKNKNYTVMSNVHLQDEKLTLKAKGLLSVMLSLPDDWNYSVLGLASLSKDGKDCIMKTIDELINAKYIVRTKEQDENGRFSGYRYDIFEIPQSEPCAEKPYSENPDTVKPDTEKPYAEKPPQYNTNNTNTLNKQNTEEQKEKDEEKDSTTEMSEKVIAYLNKKTGQKYRPRTTKTLACIRARCNEGFSLEDFMTVIDNMTEEWSQDERMCIYLRPETLFGNKFEGYLNRRASKTNVKNKWCKEDNNDDWGF